MYGFASYQHDPGSRASWRLLVLGRHMHGAVSGSSCGFSSAPRIPVVPTTAHAWHYVSATQVPTNGLHSSGLCLAATNEYGLASRGSKTHANGLARKASRQGHASWHSTKICLIDSERHSRYCRGLRLVDCKANPAGSEKAGVQEEGREEPSFKVHKVAGDGSCLFRSLCQGDYYLRTGQLLEQLELRRQAYGLRQKICQALLDRKEEMKFFIPGSFDAYVGNMMMEDTWGDEPELAVAPHCLGSTCTSS
eukprot:jgi/Botrbrau1/4593/Bobra.60_2s0079.1